MTNLWVLKNQRTGLFAKGDCLGQHDGRFSDDVVDAKEFRSFGEAADYGQNFGDDWHPVSLFDDTPRAAVMPAGFHRAYRHDY